MKALALLGGGLAALWWADQAAASMNRSAGGNATVIEKLTAKWLKDLDGKGAAYKPLLLAAEQQYGIPHLLLCRQCWNESRFDPTARSPAGALGIMQFMPATARDMGIDPLDPAQAIPAGARYLAQMYRIFGTWELALKAYNWGPGNVRKWLAAGRVGEPTETARYSREILADLNAATGGTIA